MNFVPRVMTIREPIRAPTSWPNPITKPGRNSTFPPAKKSERAQVARKIHELCPRCRPGQVEAKGQDKCHRPKRACSGTEKAVVKAQGQSKDRVEPAP